VLPSDDKYHPPTNPLLGNGHLGVLISTEPFATVQGGPPGAPAFNLSGGRGPATPTKSQGGLPILNFWLGSNAMWRMYADNEDVLGSKLMGDRVSLGGISIRLGDLFAADKTSIVFHAEQRLAVGELFTSHRSACGEFVTRTHLHPSDNVMIINCSWTPWSPAGSDVCMPTGNSTSHNLATVEVATWTFVQSTLVDHFHSPWSTPLSMAVSAGRERDAQWVTRQALPWNESSPRMVRAALATSFSASAKLTARKMYADDWIAEVKTAIVLPRGGGGQNTTNFAAVTTLAENLANSSDSSFALAERAVGMAVDAAKDPSKIVTVAEAWWEAYWNRSSVVLPTRPLVQRVWAGANAALGYIASFNSMVPAPGLDGPFVLSDQPGWNGDYTLDYNFQSPWFGVLSSNHEELVGSYLNTVFDQLPGAAAQAQRYLAAYHNTTTCPATALKFQQHISAYGGGDLNTQWELQNGQFMQWTGSWAAMLFIEHFEYTRDLRIVAEMSFPLLSGLLDYWSCYLTRVPDPSSPDGYRYDDLHDRYAEPPPAGTNPIPAIALIRRIAGAILDMAVAQGVAPHPFAADVVQHLAPLPSYTNATSGVTTWIYFEGADPVTAWASAWPIHPAQTYSTASPTPILRIAQDTVRHYKSSGTVELLYAALVRSGLQGSVRGRHRGSAQAFTASETLDRMEIDVAPRLMQNMVIREALTGGNGGWLENCGITLAINEMLVAANPTGQKEFPWLVEVFPGWPKGEPASFNSLRVKGGFGVSARYKPPIIDQTIDVTSHAGEVCAILDPWMGGPGSIAVSTVGGDVVPVAWVDVLSGDAVVFNTTVGVSYQVVWRKEVQKISLLY
jgi:hypothetical protein